MSQVRDDLLGRDQVPRDGRDRPPPAGCHPLGRQRPRHAALSVAATRPAPFGKGCFSPGGARPAGSSPRRGPRPGGPDQAQRNAWRSPLTRLSLAKEKVRILLLEGIHDNAAADLAAAGYVNVERLPGALDEADLLERIQ